MTTTTTTEPRTFSPRIGGAVGRPLPRLEDRRLVLGEGEYTDDVAIPGSLHGVVVRSPYAHALIRSIDVTAALAAPGVAAVYTGRDYLGDGRFPIAHCPYGIADPKLEMLRANFAPAPVIAHEVRQNVLAVDRVLHQGEGVAFVMADSPAHAVAASELVDVRYDELEVLLDIDRAVDAGAPLIDERVPNNIALDATRGDKDATDRAFATAEHVIEGVFHSKRVFSAHMEPRAATATYDARSETFELICGGGGVHRYRDLLAAALNVSADRVHVRQADVGGSFGSRNSLHPEAVLVAWAAFRLGRPVRWTGTRSEGFLTDFQGRDIRSKAALALDSTGRILAFRTLASANVGACTVAFSSQTNYSRIAPSAYDIPAVAIHVQAVLTNTTPTASYRGAGRPEAMFVIERLLDIAAKRLGIDRVEIRRRNIIKQTPYTTATDLVYDSGDFAGNMERALTLAGWATFEDRRAESATRGLLRGISVGNFVESPVGATQERAVIHVLPVGIVEVLIGTQSSGQGHETTFAQLVADRLNVPVRSVRLIQGDTHRIAVGGGSHSNRSMRLGGKVMLLACEDILRQAREATGRDDNDLFELAATMELTAQADTNVRIPSYPTGCAVFEVEVDPETGEVHPIAYSQIDDAGRAINPMILHGQTHGGIAQGLGAALNESMAFEPGTGQVLSGSFMGYAVPRARHMPLMNVELTEDPTAGNALGIKGGGEAGITPSPAVAIGAIVDALRDYDVEHIEMPASASKIWRIISERKGALV